MQAEAGLLLQALAACGSNDNSIRKNAESALKHYSQQGGYIQKLLLVVCLKDADSQVKLLALTELRKNVQVSSAQERLQIRQAMQGLLDDPNLHSALHKPLSEVLGAAAKQALPSGEWPDFLPWLGGNVQSPNVSHRELAVYLFGVLVNYLGPDMMEKMPELLHVCKTGIADQDKRVCRAALGTLSSVIGLTNSSMDPVSLTEIMPLLFQVLQAAVETQDYDTGRAAFSTLIDLVESRVTIPAAYLPQLVQWNLSVVSSKSVCEEYEHLKLSAITVLECMARDRPKQFAKTSLVPQTTSALYNAIAEWHDRDEEDSDSDSDETSFLAIASEALDEIARQLPSSQVFPAITSHASDGIQSQAVHLRKAACMILATVVEGCAKSTRKSLASILQIASKGVQDTEPSVRGAAAHLLGSLAEHCQPEIVVHSKDLLMALFHVLKGSEGAARDHAGYALQAVCENLTEDKNLPSYLMDLMSNLGEVLQGVSMKTKLAVLKSISWTAEAAGPRFHPFLGQLLPVLHQYMQVTEGEALQLRGAATECVGSLFASAGFEVLQPSLCETMNFAFQGLQLDAPEIREYTHFAFAQIARSARENFAAYLPQALHAAVRSLETDDGGLKLNGAGELSPSKSVALGSEDSDSDESQLEIHTAHLEEKAAAIQALASYAEHCPQAFQPYMLSTFHALCKMTDYFNEVIREEACRALGAMLTAAKSAAAPVDGSNTGGTHLVREVFYMGAKELLEICSEDDSSLVVAAAIESLAIYAEPHPLRGGSDQLAVMDDTARNALEGTLLCQEVVSDFDDWQDDDIKENKDVALISAVSELVPALIRSNVRCNEWAKDHWGLIHSLLKPKKPDAVRCCILGLVADLLKEIGSGIPVAELEKVLLCAKREAQCEEKDNRQHAALCLGMLGQAVPKFAYDHLQSILTILHPLIAEDEEDIVRDNAAAAVARLILHLPLEHFPVEQVVPPLLSALPIKEDFEEAEPVCAALMKLLQDPSAAKRLQTQRHGIFVAIQSGFKTDNLPHKVKQEIAQFLQHVQE